jgi:hypothetical protein
MAPEPELQGVDLRILPEPPAPRAGSGMSP